MALQLSRLSVHSRLWLLIFGVNFAIAAYATQLFTQGYPLGMDTFSHLPRILFLKENGLAEWHSDWYAGFPFFIFYPPLSYLITYLPTLLGLDAILSYKLVETLFLLLTPPAFYKLARKLDLGRTRALYATLAFSIVPFTIQNSVVFGRFPNIVVFPLFLLALVYSLDILKTPTKKGLMKVAILFSLIVFTHHLSAYILFIFLLIYTFTLLAERREAFRWKLARVTSLGGALALGSVIAAVWIVPFLVYSTYYGGGRPDAGILPLSVLLFLTFVLGLVVGLKKAFSNYTLIERGLTAWLIFSLVIGGLLLPGEYVLPFGDKIDAFRFLLYSSIPIALLLASPRRFEIFVSQQSLRRLAVIHNVKMWLVVLLVMNIFSGYVITQSFPTVVADQIDVGEAPAPIVNYLNSSTAFGRLLPINNPYWVYLLPALTHKPLIDGWYPQGSLIKEIEKVGLPLNWAANDTVIRFFVENSQAYGIRWVLLGNSSKLPLFEGTSFHPVLEYGRYILLESTLPVTYVDAPGGVEVSWVRETDTITLEIKTPNPRAEIVVKEAYFPAWYAFEDGERLTLNSNPYGPLSFEVEGVGVHVVRLIFSPYLEPDLREAGGLGLGG